MVLADSDKVSPASPYSGTAPASLTFAYGTITHYGQTFQNVLLVIKVRYELPHDPYGKTRRFRLFQFRSPLLPESLLISLPADT